MQRPRWQWHHLVVVALLAHVVIGVVRVPGVVWGRRCADIAEYRTRGAAAYFLDSDHLRGAAAVQWILDNVPDDAVVLWRGDSKGGLEFAPGLLAPRLLVQEPNCPPGAQQYRGRPLAVRNSAIGPQVVVLNGRAKDIELEAR